jgi:hypothetical protein
MGHTPSVEEMIAVVQAYIKERTGRNVRIIFDNPMSLRKHLIMLNEAYNYVMAQQQKEQ